MGGTPLKSFCDRAATTHALRSALCAIPPPQKSDLSISLSWARSRKLLQIESWLSKTHPIPLEAPQSVLTIASFSISRVSLNSCARNLNSIQISREAHSVERINIDASKCYQTYDQYNCMLYQPDLGGLHRSWNNDTWVQAKTKQMKSRELEQKVSALVEATLHWEI